MRQATITVTASVLKSVNKQISSTVAMNTECLWLPCKCCLCIIWAERNEICKIFFPGANKRSRMWHLRAGMHTSSQFCAHVAHELLKIYCVLFCSRMRCVNRHNVILFSLFFSISPEGCRLQWRAARRVQLQHTKSLQLLEEKNGRRSKSLPEATIYLFVLLIFLKSQQGSYVQLHPEETNQNKLNERWCHNHRVRQAALKIRLHFLWVPELTLLSQEKNQ